MARSARHPRRTHGGLLAAIALLASACTQRADIVAHAVTRDAGARDAGPHDAASPPDPCSPSERLRHTPWPPEVVKALLIPSSCTIPFSAFIVQGSPDAGITQDEFRNLFAAPPQRDGSQPRSGACNDQGFGLDLSLAKQQFMLCPTSCSELKRLIARQLAQDGCDGPFDAGPSLGFPFMLPLGTPGTHDAGSPVLHDASALDDAGHL